MNDGPDVYGRIHRITAFQLFRPRQHQCCKFVRNGLDATGRRYLVSTGRYALRGIGRAQDLYTLDPDMAANEAMAGSYERYAKG